MASNCVDSKEGVWGPNQIQNGSAEAGLTGWTQSNVTTTDTESTPAGVKCFVLGSQASMSQVIAPDPLACVEDIKVTLEYLPEYPHTDVKVETTLNIKITYENAKEELLKVSCEEQYVGV